MKLEEQVCSLELAQKLKSLGINQDGMWSWYDATDRDDTPALNRASNQDCTTCGFPMAPYDAEFSAFTVAELGDMLPTELNQRGWENWENRLECYTIGKDWVVSYQAGDLMATRTKAQTEADARAKMLIYLIENKLVDAIS